MADTKASGLRPPSKIGRPCCAAAPKPNIPTSPAKAPMKDSMEHLWETHGRRLSEAGVRRGSDTSVVLTEDTDSFIIGDRVWVGGNKPGLIAYIGETQFAPGDWAGVVLDEPIGKNDGSVAGSRYFQCEPKRGVFSRLTRLTRQPLPEAATSPSALLKTPTSPAESMRGSLNKSMSPSLNTSTTSLSSVTHRELRLGDRVIVSSSQGSKTGVLRFMGTTEFAPGEWCGIELDDPLGKNDGSVGDKRYFDCRPKYGLFAPLQKVSRSPSNKRSSTCIVHKPSGAALNMSLRKLGSRESLASLSSIASTAASTATRGATSTTRRAGMRTSTPVRSSMQEMLKERQQEIEILRKERDLERERVTRAANQADQAEQSVVSLKQEYEKYREEMEKKVQEAQLALAKLLDEKSLLGVQLEEEHRKCEDLLFRFEEESVNKDDIQKETTAQSVTNALNENKIKALEKQLSEERERVVQLEQDSTKLFEAEEELQRLRTELSGTAIQDQNASQDLQHLRQTLEETKKTLEDQAKERNALVEQYDSQIKALELQLTEKEKTSTTQKETEASLRQELEKIKQNLKEKCKHIEKMTNEFEIISDSSKKEMEQLKISIENITKEKETAISEFKRIVDEKDNVIKQKMEEIEAESKRHLEMQQSNLEQMKSDNVKHIEELSSIFKNQLNEKDSQIQVVAAQLEQKNAEIEKLTNELTSQQTSNLSNDEQLKKVLQQIADLNGKLKAEEEGNKILANKLQTLQSSTEEETKKLVEEKQKLEKDIANLKNSSTVTAAQLNKLNEDLVNKEKEFIELRESKVKDIDELTKNLTSQIEGKDKTIRELNSEIAQKTDELKIIHKESADLNSTTAKKDDEVKELLKQITELQNTVALSQQTKASLEDKLHSFESDVADLRRKLAQLTEQKEKLESDITNLISSSADSSDQLIKYNEDLRKKEKQLDETCDKASQLQNSLESTEAKLNRTEQDLNQAHLVQKELTSMVEAIQGQLVAEKNLKEQLTQQLEASKKVEQELVENIEKNNNVEQNLKVKMDEISKLTNQLKTSHEEISQLQDKCATLEKSHQDSIGKMNEEKMLIEKKMSDLELSLNESQQAAGKLHQSKATFEAEVIAKEQRIKELTEKFSLETEAKTKLEKVLAERDVKLNQTETKILELQEEKSNLDNSLKAVNSKYTDSLTEIALLKSAKDNSSSEAQIKLSSAQEQLAHVSATNEALTKSLDEMTKSADDLKTKLAAVVESNKVVDSKLSQVETAAKQKEDIIAELNNTIISIKDEYAQSKTQLTKLGEDLKMKEQELNTTSEGKSVLQETMKSLQERLQVTQKDLSAKNDVIVELSSKVEELRKANEQSLESLHGSKEAEIIAKQLEVEAAAKENVELRERKEVLEKTVNEKSTELNAKEEIISRLDTKIKALEEAAAQKAMADQQSRSEELNAKQLELDAIRKQNTDLEKSKDTLEKLLKEKVESIGALMDSLENREKEAELKANGLVERLNVAVTESTQFKETQKHLEKELKLMTSKWLQATEDLKLATQNHKNNHEVEALSKSQMIQAAGGDMKQHNNAGKDVDMEKMLEENELAKGQIDFLNSVIVDMKRKNDALLCKVEVLEMGVPANEADDYNLNTLNKSMTTLRMFCDICDQFDLHDTEDCPRQAQGSPEPVIPRTPKKSPVERPYCENCEIFGHDTKDCDDGETF